MSCERASRQSARRGGRRSALARAPRPASSPGRPSRPASAPVASALHAFGSVDAPSRHPRCPVCCPALPAQLFCRMLPVFCAWQSRNTSPTSFTHRLQPWVHSGGGTKAWVLSGLLVHDTCCVCCDSALLRLLMWSSHAPSLAWCLTTSVTQTPPSASTARPCGITIRPWPHACHGSKFLCIIVTQE